MNRNELACEFKALGLKEGTTLMLHSSYLSLGPVEGGPDAVVDALLDVLGPKGTLMVPVFGALGILTDVVKKRPNAVTSLCPRGTVSAIGPNAEALMKDHWKADTAHGQGTPFTRLAEMDGYIMLLGVDEDRNTTLHSIEALLELPYLSDTTGTVDLGNGETVTKTWKYYPGPHRDFIGIERYFREEGAIAIGRIGNAQVRLISAKDLFEIGMELGEHNPAFCLCDNPACADCTRQRAAIFADGIAKESFKLTVSSRLAGRYVPEMVEKMKAAGIKYIELDYIQGKAAVKMNAAKLTAAVAELKEGGIEVSALRAFYTPADYAPMMALAKAAGIGRVILPLGANSAEAVKAAAEAGIVLSFCNAGQEARLAAREFAAIATEGMKATFNPPAFVRSGEMPFLGSYKAGRYIKTIGQLDLADATWDGEARRLARGNGEVKELLSILRCSNQPEWVCLGGGSAFPGCLTDAVDDLTRLLENM